VSIFALHGSVIADYRDFVKSFFISLTSRRGPASSEKGARQSGDTPHHSRASEQNCYPIGNSLRPGGKAKRLAGTDSGAEENFAPA
jgi:hypothetical protein